MMSLRSASRTVSLGLYCAHGANIAFLFGAMQLGPAVFSDIASLLALMGILSVLQSALRLETIMEIRSQKTEKHHIREAATVGILSMLALVLLSPVLSRTLHFSSPMPIVLLAFTALPTALLGAQRGSNTVKKHFSTVAISQALEMALRIPLGLFVLLDGYHETDTGWILLFATVLTYLVTSLIEKEGKKQWRLFTWKKPKAHSIAMLVHTTVSIVLLTLCMRIDTLWARHALSPEHAGVYGVLATAGLLLFLLTAGGAQAAGAYIRKRTVRRTMHTIYKPIVLFGIAGACASFFVSDTMLSILSAHAYRGYAGSLTLLAIAFSAFAILNAALQCLLVLRKRRTLLLIAVTACLQAAGLWFFGDSIQHIAIVQVCTLSLAAIVSSLALWSVQSSRPLQCTARTVSKLVIVTFFLHTLKNIYPKDQ